MLGFIEKTGQGDGDRLLEAITAELTARGLVLVGVIQTNYVFDPEHRCHMDLTVLGQGPKVRISQERGRHARGCRLDPQALADAVAHVETAMASGDADLLVINKFGKAELDGSGFREVIGKALMQDLPVLTTISPGHRTAFLDYAGDLATELPADVASVAAWCMSQQNRLIGEGLDAG